MESASRAQVVHIIHSQRRYVSFVSIRRKAWNQNSLFLSLSSEVWSVLVLRESIPSCNCQRCWIPTLFWVLIKELLNSKGTQHKAFYEKRETSETHLTMWAFFNCTRVRERRVYYFAAFEQTLIQARQDLYMLCPHGMCHLHDAPPPPTDVPPPHGKCPMESATPCSL